MAAAATAVRYAPEDPSLPKPWRGLVDGKTGYLYFWNPETNVTQYERPVASSLVPSAPLHKSSPASISSSISVHQSSSHGQHNGPISNDDGERYDRGNSGGGSKLAPEARNYQGARSGLDYSHNVSSGTVGAGHGGTPAKGPVSSGAGSGVSAESYRREHEITVTGGNVPSPFTSFEDTGFSSEILREVYDAGFSAPTPIQAQSWPIALQSRDIVAVAKTGSGKTLGYLIPGFIHLKRCHNNPQMGPMVLVLSPTRELATQIQDEAVKFGKSSKISCTCLYGGAPKVTQLRELNRGADIVVATPGRLNDILEMRRVSLHQVSYLVLDEADRMLDMGFEPQIRKIVKEVPTRRQTLMFTATWPKEVRKIAADLLVDPVQVNIGNVDELVANKSITQYVEVQLPMDKHRRLEQILRSQEPGSKIIIFCSTKKMCDQLSRKLSHQFGASAIHGDKSQGERDHVLSHFRTGRSPVLVATDVAARGLDIKDIRVVINYDFPTGIEDYVHRIGRTGRAGATGLAYTFFSDQDAKHASDLIKVLEGANQLVPAEIRDMASRGVGMGRFRCQWGSGPSGHGGHDGGRGRSHDTVYGGRGWVAYSERGAGRGSERELRDSDRYGGRSFHDGHDTEASGSHHYKSFHESMLHATEKHRRSRSRSPNRGSGWGDTQNTGHSRSPSHSVDRFNRALPAHDGSAVRSFHQSMMEQPRSASLGNRHFSPHHNDNPREFTDSKTLYRQRHDSRTPSDSDGREKFEGSYDDGTQDWGNLSRGQQDDREIHANGEI